MPDERDQAVRELVAEWLRRARADLAVANLVEDDRIAPEILVFHAQQAAEKALKSILVWRQVEFPCTHDIRLLLELCRTAGFEVSETLAPAMGLTRYAVATRYPGEDEPVDRQEAREAVELAGRVQDWAEAHLAQE
jgi:HEPN domain-containing protein